MGTPQKAIQRAQQVLQTEAAVLASMAESIDSAFVEAVEIILKHPGKIMVCGLGKSGHAAKKMAATLCSTGTPAVFLHAAEAVHGDLGVYHPGDPTILLSKSGTTAELVRLIPTLKRLKSPIIAIVGNANSEIARKADVVLLTELTREADPLGIVPTSSTIMAMAMGDALASVLLERRGFTAEDFGVFHPSGQLGRNLTLSVADAMHPAEQTACITAKTRLRDVVVQMTESRLGAASVVNPQGKLLGIITDGDVRRLLVEEVDLNKVVASDIMTQDPSSIGPEASLATALSLMEDRPENSKLSILPVLDENGQYLGLLQLHDIYQPSHD